MRQIFADRFELYIELMCVATDFIRTKSYLKQHKKNQRRRRTMKSKLDLQLYQLFKSNKFHFSIGELESSLCTQYALTTKISDRYALRIFATKTKHSLNQSNRFVRSENLKCIDTIKQFIVSITVYVFASVSMHILSL